MRKISLMLVLLLLLGSFPVNAAEETVYDIGTQTFTTLNLTKAANMGFADEVAGDGKGGWGDQGAANDFRTFTFKGRTLFNGIPFDIIAPESNGGSSCIVLRGESNQYFPTSAEIEVNQKAGGVYFLHAASHSQGNISEIVGKYTFVYNDGTSSDVTVRGKKDVFNWWGKASSETCIPIWTGANGSTNLISLGMYACPNPYPDKTVSKVVASTPGDGAALIVVAATLTDEKPYLPLPPDIANPKSTSHWYPYTMPRVDDVKGTIMDMSHLLDAPAGKHGFVHAENDNMFFEDGTPFKFWGINIVGEMLFMSHGEAEMLADWVAVQGFNLVRIHHMDGPNDRSNNIFGRLPRKSTRLDEESMDKLCYLLNEFKKRGIYWFIDNATNRMTFEDDNIQDHQTVSGAQKGYDFYDPIVQQLHKEFSTQLFNWYNPYTGLRIKDDPALICTDLVNENSFVELSAPRSEHYSKQIDALLTDWLKEKYQTDEAIAAAWAQTNKKGVQEGESLAAGYHYGAVADIADFSNQRREDMRNFAMDVQTKYTDETYKYFKDMGVKALVTGCTIWYGEETAILNMNAATDFIDVHSYWSHPTSGWRVETGTKFGETVSMLTNKNMGLLGYLMNRGVYNKVQTISEWNACEPNPTSAEGPLLMAAYSRLHDFHPIAFTFCVYNEWQSINQTPETYPLNEVLSFFGNPLKMSGMPAASFIAQSDAVKEADEGYYTLYRKEDISKMSKRYVTKDPSVGLIGKSGVVFEEQYDPSCNSDEVLKLAAEGKESGVYTSVTGELTTDKKKEIFALNTELAQAASGYLSDDIIETNDLIFNIDTEFSVNSLVAVDKQPIEISDRMLLTTQARNRNSGMNIARDFSEILEGGSAPVLIEPVEGEIIIKNTNEYEVWALASSGQKVKKAATVKTPEGYTKILLTADNKAMNYEIVKKRQSNQKISEKKATYTLNKSTDMFTDISDPQTKQAAERLCALGTIRATGEKTFSPNQNITRGEFGLWLMQTLDPSPTETLQFSDVSEESAANKLRSLGVINDEALNADDYLSTEDMYSMIEGSLKAIGRKNASVPREYEGDLVTRGTAAKVIFDILWKVF